MESGASKRVQNFADGHHAWKLEVLYAPMGIGVSAVLGTGVSHKPNGHHAGMSGDDGPSTKCANLDYDGNALRGTVRSRPVPKGGKPGALSRYTAQPIQALPQTSA